ncbi:unnamed protein product [Cylindrotheca closterium]|uniref:Uncharacterized protein n=1 Tax=Cylindrotheca closterium TaxID=2856 RepID=A0AAD2PVV8_9STRA|nr:unnamed protein product [Cylindrotheca closterium]
MEFQPIWMTADIPWQPDDPDSRRQEEALRQQIDADYQAPYHQLASFTRLDSTLPTAACLDRLPQVLGDSNNVVCGVHSLTIRSMKTSGKSYLIKPDQLARRWRTSIECARRTLEKTTQRAVRDWSVVQGSCRFRPVQYQLEYPRLKTNVYVDVKFGPCKSAEGNTCVAVYATPVQWARAYPLNKESDPDLIKEPTTYLGATISKHKLDGDDYFTWAIGSEEYLQVSLRVVKKRIAPMQLTLKKKVYSTLPTGYKPELDSTPFVDDDTAILYMQLIGILRWLVELGGIDVAAKKHPDRVLVMDCGYADHLRALKKADYSQFYEFTKDELPSDMPTPLGKAVEFTMFVDASHAANVVTRQSRTGVLIFVNKAPIIWYSKKQNSVKTSSFGSEFSALKTGVELLEGLRFKLRMMGVPIQEIECCCISLRSLQMCN